MLRCRHEAASAAGLKRPSLASWHPESCHSAPGRYNCISWDFCRESSRIYFLKPSNLPAITKAIGAVRPAPRQSPSAVPEAGTTREPTPRAGLSPTAPQPRLASGTGRSVGTNTCGIRACVGSAIAPHPSPLGRRRSPCSRGEGDAPAPPGPPSAMGRAEPARRGAQPRGLRARGAEILSFLQIPVRERADRNTLISLGSCSARTPGTSSGLLAPISHSPYRESAQFSKQTDPRSSACSLFGREEGQRQLWSKAVSGEIQDPTGRAPLLEPSPKAHHADRPAAPAALRTRARAGSCFQRHRDINFTLQSLVPAQGKMAQNLNTSSASLPYRAATEIRFQTE